METQYINLNMTPIGVTPTFHISQYDVGRMLGFIVHSGGVTVDLDTYTCTVEATRSDGTAITSAVATNDNIGTFEVTPTMSNNADKYRCQLVIVDANSKRIASLPFDMEVTKAAMDENSEAIEEDASLYQQYTEAVQGAIAEANADIQAEENARIAAVSAESTARATQDGLLQSQIDQIIAPSGEAPSAAEVQNARIGADGVTYSTLGDAIRGQVTDLKNALSLTNASVFEGENFTRGKFLKSNGLETDNADYCITEYVPVSASGRITVICGTIPDAYPQAWVVEYNSNKEVVDYWGVPKTEAGRNVDPSASTAFVRMGFVLGYNARILKYSTGEIIWHPESEGLYGMKEDIKTANAEITQAFTASGIISATFYPGIATTEGTIDTSTPTYANATEIISYPYELLITVEKGYRFFLQLFNNDGTYSRTVGWQTDKYNLSANQKFAITVAQDSLNTTYNAVENEFRLCVKIGRVNKQWEGKQWYAFGTSISDTTFPMPYDLPGVTGKYPPYLVQLSGLIHTNFALGGSRITNAATADRTTILQKILDTDLSDADIITIDGFVNDFGACEIGDLENLTPENADDTTLFGAMFLAITHCLQNSNAVVCLLTDNTGKIWITPQGQTHPMDLRPWKKDGHGKTQNDYQDAMRKIAKYLGCYCIDAGSMASINYCHPEYLQDTIHQSESGGKQYANAIWSVLKEIQPNVPRT